MSKPSSNAFGRDEMTALLGGGLSEKAAAALLQNQKPKAKAGSVPQRHRTARVRAYHQLLVEEQQQQQEHAEADVELSSSSEDDGADDVVKTTTSTAASAHRRTKQAAVILQKKRRRPTSDHSTSSDDDSSNSSPSGDEKVKKTEARSARPTKKHGSSDDSSSSSSEDEGAAQRRRARLARLKQQSMASTTTDPTRSVGDDAEIKKLSPVIPDKDTPVDSKVEGSSPPSPSPLPPPVSKKPTAQSSSSSSGTSESESSDSDNSSSSDDDSTAAAPPRPVFVPKHARRLPTAETEQAQAEASHAEAQQAAKRRQAASRVLVQQVVASAQQQAVGKHENVDIGFAGARNARPDDADEVDDESKKQQQYDAWQVREVLRLLADWDMEQRRLKEAAERERRRRMTDEERYQEDVASGAYQKPGQGQTEAIKGRYFHKGAFYMDDEEWDANDVRHKAAEYARATTESEKVDQKALPTVMRVKKFGFAGQSKYKGLHAEDTTDKTFQPLARPSKKS